MEGNHWEKWTARAIFVHIKTLFGGVWDDLHTCRQQISLCEVLFKDTAVVNVDVSRAEVNKVLCSPVGQGFALCGSLHQGSSWQLEVLRVRQTLHKGALFFPVTYFQKQPNNTQVDNKTIYQVAMFGRGTVGLNPVSPCHHYTKMWRGGHLPHVPLNVILLPVIKQFRLHCRGLWVSFSDRKDRIICSVSQGGWVGLWSCK